MGLVSLLIILVIALQALHLLEETKTGFRRRFPLGQMPLPLFLGINMVIYSFCFANLALSLTGNHLADWLAWPLAVGTLANGLGHIAVMLLTWRYFPGGMTALPLAAVSASLVATLAASA